MPELNLNSGWKVDRVYSMARERGGGGDEENERNRRLSGGVVALFFFLRHVRITMRTLKAWAKYVENVISAAILGKLSPLKTSRRWKLTMVKVQDVTFSFNLQVILYSRELENS